MHYSAYVVIPGHAVDASKAVEVALAPYGSEVEVPAYTRTCDCTVTMNLEDCEDGLPRYRRGKKAPDEGCEVCGGSGEHETTENPKAVWDWWELGGSWDQDFDGVSVAKASTVKRLLVADQATLPWGFVDGHGIWHQGTPSKAEGVLWGMTDRFDSKWRSWVIAQLDELGEASIAMVDIHS